MRPASDSLTKHRYVGADMWRERHVPPNQTLSGDETGFSSDLTLAQTWHLFRSSFYKISRQQSHVFFSSSSFQQSFLKGAKTFLCEQVISRRHRLHLLPELLYFSTSEGCSRLRLQTLANSARRCWRVALSVDRWTFILFSWQVKEISATVILLLSFAYLLGIINIPVIRCSH